MKLSLNGIANAIQRLDERLFNRKGRVPNYRGTSKILLLPIVFGIGCGVATLLKSFWGGKQSEDFLDTLKIVAFWVWFLNELLLIKHVFVLPGIFRKFFYPVFVAVITVPAFAAIYIVSYNAAGAAIVVVGCMLFLPAAFSAVKDTPRSSAPVSLPSSDSSNNGPRVVESIEIDDGTSFGRRLERCEGSNIWTDNSGRSYERNFDGSFTEK